MDELPADPNCYQWEVSRMDLFNHLRVCVYKNKKMQFEELVRYVQGETKTSHGNMQAIKAKIAKFNNEFRSRWASSNRIFNRFIASNSKWLKGTIKFTKYGVRKSKRGRPKRSFEESSERTKRRTTEILRRSFPPKQLAYATQISLRATGQSHAAAIVRDVTMTTPKRAIKYREAFRSSQHFTNKQISPDVALSMIIEANLSRHQYNVVRSNAKKIFPCYSYIQKAKLDCYPDKEGINVTETTAEIKLQALLDHTANRLMKSQNEVFSVCRINKDLKLISKWGLDGTSTTQYHQKFQCQGETDSSVFISSFVPLLLSGKRDGKEVVIWKNPRPSSTRYCRPIKFTFQKETVDLTVIEKNRVDREIKTLKRTEVEINNSKFEIEHTLLFTMIDGKVCNAVTETKYTQRCYICNLTSKDFNNLDKCISTPIKEHTLEFGLSILHAWIRTMEMFIHISYNIPLKKWKVPKAEKTIKEDRQKFIKKKFEDELGMIIDQPKQGFGNTNTGNVARRFFRNHQTTAQITELDEDLIKRFYIVLQTISCDFSIDPTKFKEFCYETARKYVDLYGWYPMPPSVHKILLHGATVIDNALLPIGQLSEEAQEARNKEFKKYREDFSRKSSRIRTNQDVLNRLLISSDPLITSLRKINVKNRKILPQEVLDMLLEPEEPISPLHFCIDSSSDESESE